MPDRHLILRAVASLGITGGLTAFFILSAGFFLPAGGRGLPLSIGLPGVVAVLAVIWSASARNRVLDLAQSPVFWSVLSVFGFAAFSFLWSPYDNPEWALRTLVFAPLFFLGAAMLTHGPSPQIPALKGAVVVTGLAAFALFAFEVLSGASLSVAYRTDLFSSCHGVSALINPDGSVGGGNVHELNVCGLARRALGEGLSGWLLLFPAIAALLIGFFGRTGLVAGVLIFGVSFYGALSFGITANLMGVFAIALAGVFVVWFPGRAVDIALGVFALAIVLAPLLGGLIHVFPQTLRDTLPYTFDYRLEIWSYTLERILASPFWGHGFDAGRVETGMVTLRGFDVLGMPMHPHAFGLQIWYELGGIGVALCLTALYCARTALACASRTRLQSFALSGCLVAYVAIASFSYGVWQEWWLAAASLALGSALLVQRRAQP